MQTHQTLTTTSQAQLSIWIEQLMLRLLTQPLLSEYDAVVLLQPMTQCLVQYNPAHSYSPLLQQFWQICTQLGWLGQPVLPQLSITSVQQFGWYVHQRTNRQWLARKASDRLYETKQKQQLLQCYTQSILKHYARVLLIRVDLGYIEGSANFVSIDQVYTHLNMLLAKKSTGEGVFANLKGYAWCIEQGVDKGYHIHLACFYAGYQHQNDWFIANSIGCLWLEIVGGSGMFYSCNTPAVKAHYACLGRLGVGMIYRDDPIAVCNAVQAVSYLAEPSKPDQHLRIRPKRSRTFATGQF
jgi:hypothetical protein